MYLKTLKLQSFKSFADDTTLNFEPGVTAIVGPNGCGKSNVADAIRWVLGEQSAKALRGNKMQDVIFEGADARQPAQMCEVALLFTNCEKQLGSEFHEIEIMRRIERDGSGEYFFNGQACRLKVIRKLFMDTGVGHMSYSIMAQGQIDQILSSKPEERRVVFEEAAGITEYKSQRREAMNKLALTEQNLARISDIINEVGRQIGSLRRQAAKAIRYKHLSFRLRKFALAQGSYQWKQLSTMLNEVESRISGLSGEADARHSLLEELTRSLGEKKSERASLAERLQDAQQTVFDLRSQREQAKNQSGLIEVRHNSLVERLDESKDSLAALEMQIKELASQADIGVQDKQLQLSLLGSSDAAFQERNRELAVVEGEIAKAEQQICQERFQLLQAGNHVARLRTDSFSFEVNARTSQSRFDQLTVELGHLSSGVEAASAIIAKATQRLEEARADQSRINNEVQVKQAALQEATQKSREAQRRIQEIDRSLAQKTARLKLFQQLQEQWEGFGEGAKALLSGRLAAGDQRFTPITQGLEVKLEDTKALETLLGSSVEAITVSDLEIAKKIFAQLESEQIGSVHLQVHATDETNVENEVELPAFLRPAASAVANLDGHPANILLSACYLASDLQTFLDFWKENPSFSFLFVATPKGDLVDRRGLIFGGYHKKPNNSLLQREADLREAGKAVVAEQAAHNEQRALVDQINNVLNEAEQTLEQQRKDMLIASQHTAAFTTELKNAQRSREEEESRFARMENELSNLKRNHKESLTSLAKAQAQFAEAEAAITVRKQHIAEIEASINEKRIDRDLKKESLAQARIELAERRQKVELLDRSISEIEHRRVRFFDLHDQHQIEIKTWSEQIAQLEQESRAQQHRIESIAATLQAAQKNVEGISVKLVEVEGKIVDYETSLDSIRSEAESAMGELSRNEVKVAETRARAQFLADEIAREFQSKVSALDWKNLLWHADDEPEEIKELDLNEKKDRGQLELSALLEPTAIETSVAIEDAPATESKPKCQKKKTRPNPTEADLAALDNTDWTEVKTKVDALRQRLGSMGAINPVAIEEYSELKQRYKFLKDQNDDLTNAKAHLLEAIDDINRTSSEQFKGTLEQIRKNFSYTFNILFGGGRTEIELVTANDPLESGIEIVAQPPGTKLKSITLLSGGQKTLTAVAILFALYMVKPSPFCLLDELDAPLDESNIDRFTNLLKQFANESQFIIITHNKNTIGTADVIYGVTMQERGVSRMLSIKFDKIKG